MCYVCLAVAYSRHDVSHFFVFPRAYFDHFFTV